MLYSFTHMLQISFVNNFLHLIYSFWGHFRFSNIWASEGPLERVSWFYTLLLLIDLNLCSILIPLDILGWLFSLSVFWKYYSNYWFPQLHVKIITQYNSISLWIFILNMFYLLMVFWNFTLMYLWVSVFSWAILNFLNI